MVKRDLPQPRRIARTSFSWTSSSRCSTATRQRAASRPTRRCVPSRSSPSRPMAWREMPIKLVRRVAMPTFPSPTAPVSSSQRSVSTCHRPRRRGDRVAARGMSLKGQTAKSGAFICRSAQDPRADLVRHSRSAGAATRSSASGKLEHGIRGRTRRPDTARASAAAVGHECDRHPRRVEHEPGQQHELSRHWADRRPRKELVERLDRCRMDQKLANIGRYLNEKDPTVVVPQPPTNGLEKGDVETWGNVVLVKGRVPAVVDANTLPAEDRSEKMDFQDMRPDAEEIEEAVPPALDQEKYGDQQADQHQR